MPTFKLKWMNVHTPSLILTHTNTHSKSHLKILVHRSMVCSILQGKAGRVYYPHMVYRTYIGIQGSTAILKTPV